MENKIIELIEVSGADIEICRELCNDLMKFQKSKAFMMPEVFDYMNFDTRMKVSYDTAERSHVVVAMEEGLAVGYVFSTVEAVTESNEVPGFAQGLTEEQKKSGLYPKWMTPQLAGHLNNLYLRPEYRSTGLGKRLFDASMEWLEAQPDIKHLFIHVSNGNTRAGEFYVKNGFTFSHDVFGGFIKAYYKELER